MTEEPGPGSAMTPSTGRPVAGAPTRKLAARTAQPRPRRSPIPAAMTGSTAVNACPAGRPPAAAAARRGGAELAPGAALARPDGPDLPPPDGAALPPPDGAVLPWPDGTDSPGIS